MSTHLYQGVDSEDTPQAFFGHGAIDQGRQHRVHLQRTGKVAALTVTRGAYIVHGSGKDISGRFSCFSLDVIAEGFG